MKNQMDFIHKGVNIQPAQLSWLVTKSRMVAWRIVI